VAKLSLVAQALGFLELVGHQWTGSRRYGASSKMRCNRPTVDPEQGGNGLGAEPALVGRHELVHLLNRQLPGVVSQKALIGGA
jgi:hypothetical protein